MPEQTKPFVVNDRRKFTMDGDLRPDAEGHKKDEEQPVAPASAPVQDAASTPNAEPQITELPSEDLSGGVQSDLSDAQPDLKEPTAEQMEQSRIAYEATADRLDTAIRAANPGMDHPPQMNFEQLVQSVYMTAIMQLGGGTPDEEQPRLDLLGARQSIDMLGVLSARTAGNLSAQEKRLLDGALFDSRLAFLEVTQALARSAAAKMPPSDRPSLVR